MTYLDFTSRVIECPRTSRHHIYIPSYSNIIQQTRRSNGKTLAFIVCGVCAEAFAARSGCNVGIGEESGFCADIVPFDTAVGCRLSYGCRCSSEQNKESWSGKHGGVWWSDNVGFRCTFPWGQKWRQCVLTPPRVLLERVLEMAIIFLQSVSSQHSILQTKVIFACAGSSAFEVVYPASEFAWPMRVGNIIGKQLPKLAICFRWRRLDKAYSTSILRVQIALVPGSEDLMFLDGWMHLALPRIDNTGSIKVCSLGGLFGLVTEFGRATWKSAEQYEIISFCYIVWSTNYRTRFASTDYMVTVIPFSRPIRHL